MGIVSNAKKISKTPAVQQSVKTNKLLKEYEDWASANGITRKPTTATSKLTLPEWGDNFTAEQKAVMNAMYTDIMYQNDIASFERQRTLGQKNTPYASAPSTPPISHTSSNTSAAAPSVSYKPQTAAEHIAVPNNGTFARTSLFTAAGDNALPAHSTNTRNISSSQISRPSTSVTAPASTYSDLQSRMSILRQQIQDETDSTRRDELTKEYNSIKDYAAQNYQQGAKSRLADMSVNRTQLETRKTWLENQKAELQKQYAISVTQNAGNATSANTNANFDQTLSEITDPFVRQKVLEARRQYNNNPDQYNATALNADAAQAYQKLGAVNSELSSINAQLDQLKNSGEGYFLTKNAENGYTDMQYQPDFSGAKQAIVFIDNPQNSNPASATRKIVVSDSEYWGLMTDTEKQTMNYIAEKQGNDAAAKYVSEYLMPSLLQRRYEAQKSALPSGQDITFGQGVALFGASTVANFLSSPKAAANMYAQRMMRGLSGNEYNAPLNAYNAAAYETQLSNDVMSGTLGQDLNDRFGTVELPFVGERGLGDLVSMGSSTVQSVATALLGSAGFGAVGLGAMGSEVTMQSYYDGISRGLSEDQALAYAAASGIAEVLSEKVSLESILNVESGPALLKILKQAGVEGSEEIASQLLQTAADEIISGDKSQLSQAVATYMDQGMTYDQAKKAAGNDWVKDTLFQGFAGFAQGGVMAGAARGFSAAYNSAQTRRDNRTSQTQETPVQPSQAPTGTSPSPGTPAAAKEAADALTSAMKQSEDAETYAVNSDGERNIVTPLIIKNVGTDETSVTVRDAQGSTFSVPLSEVEFATNMGDDYAYAAGMANDEVANAFLAYVGDAAHKEDIAAGMSFVYERATEGRKLESIQKSVIAQPLNEQQLRAAYDLGVNQRTEKIAQEQAAATERRKSLPFKVGTIDYGEIDMASLNETQRERATLAAEIVSLSGVNVHLYESKPGADGMFRGADGELAPNGYYVGSTGDIFLDVNAGRNVAKDNFQQSAILAAAAHEMTHMAKTASPELYRQYQDAVVWYLEQDGVDVEALIDKAMSRANGAPTREIALEEIAANVAAPLLGTSDFVNRLYEARPQQALTLGQKIVEFVKALKDRIMRAYKGVTMPAEARLARKRLDDLAKPWADMMADAARLNETEATQETPAREPAIAPRAANKPDGTVGPWDEPAMPEAYHIDKRNFDNVFDKAEPAFMNAYKYSRFYMLPASNALLSDLGMTVRAEEPMPVDDMATEWIAGNRITTPEIERLLEAGSSYADIERVLKRLSAAQENADLESTFPESQTLKRIEIVIDGMLSSGYKSAMGQTFAPDRDYLEYKAALPGAAGEAIPENAVSGSFAEFADADVRYSVRERDAEYLAAVERGDMEAAQKMVDEAAKAAGYTLKGYHGTSQPTYRYDRVGYGDEKDYKNKRLPFTVFKTGQNGNIYMATNRQVADAIKGRFDGVPGTTMGVFVRFENPFVAKEHIYTSVPFYYNIPTPTEMRSAGYKKADVSTEEISAYARENGYDGVIIEGIREGAGTYTDDYIAFGSNQIKLSDPVVYDDSGSVIPLSERFNAGNEDIRYSVRDSGDVDSEGNALTEAQAEFFKDSQVLDDYGDLQMVYHTTYDDFTVFLRKKLGSITDTNATDPDLAATSHVGFWFNTQDLRKNYGKSSKVLSGYLNITNPYELNNVFEVADEIAERGGGLNGARNFVRYLRENGYDGVIAREDHEFGGTSYIALDSNQFKLSDNLEPSGKKDIRYSQRDPEDISAREALATALMGATQNEREKKMLTTYKEQIRKYDGIQKDITEKRARIRELTFGKYERTTATRDELTKLKNQVNILWDQLARQDSTLLKLEAMEPLKALGEREQKKAVAKVRAQMNEKIKAIREQRDTKLAEQKQQTQERIQRMREGRKDTEIRGKIKKLVGEFNTRLMRPTEGRYVPKELIRTVVELGEIINTNAREPQSLRAKDKIAAIRNAYLDLKNRGGYENVYDETVDTMISDLAKMVEGRSIYQLTSDELTMVYETMRAVRKMVTDAVKVFGDEKKRNAFQIGREATEELRRSRGAMKKFPEKYVSMQLSPERMFNRFGNFEDGAWDTLYKILNDGQHEVARIAMESNAIFKPLIEGKNRDNVQKLVSYKDADLVDVGLRDKQGNTVKITRGMMLSLYKHLQNEQNAAHVYYGGLTMPNLKEYYDGGSEAWGRKQVEIAGYGTQLADIEYKISKATTEAEKNDLKQRKAEIEDAGRRYAENVRANIEAELNDYDRAMLAAATRYYDEYSKDVLNNATMARYGFEKARVNNYYPIHTDAAYRNATFDQIKRDMTLESAGFMKERVNAKNPILLEDITDVTRRQIDRVSQYAGMLVPMSDFNKVYGTTYAGFSMSLQKALQSAYGANAMRYVENIVADLQGARRREPSIFDVAKGNYAKAVLTLNLSVTMKQAASYPTAAAVVGWKPLAKALGKGFARANRTLIDKYTPLLYLRSQGMSTTELGDIRAMQGWDKKLTWLTGWIQSVDTATVGRLWSAAEYYVNDNFKGLEKGTQAQIDAGESAYYQKVAEVFNRIVEETQPNYAPLQRPDILRNPNALVRSLTMFMTQRLQNFGIIYDASANYGAKAREARRNDTLETRRALGEARTQLAHAVTSQVVSSIVLNLMTIAGAAVLHRMNPWRDDNDEITFDSLAQGFGWDMLGTVLGNVVGGSEIAQLVEAIINKQAPYDIEPGGIATLNNMMQSMYSLATNGMKLFNTEYETPDDFNKAISKYLKGDVYRLGSDIAQLFGIPLQNTVKLMQGIYQNGIDAVNGEFGSFNAGVERGNTYYYGQLYDLAAARDKAGFQTRLAEVAEEREVTESDALKGVREAIGEAYLAGEIDALTANALLADYVGERDKDRKVTLGEWNYKRDTGESYAGMKELYLDGSLTLSQAVEARVKYGMVDKATASATVNEWRYELDTGRVWGEMGADMLNGKISESAARKYLTTYGGKSTADANESINKWIYEDATGKDFTRYSYVYDAIAAGSKAQYSAAVTDMMSDYGMDRDTVEKQVRTYIKGLVGDQEIPASRAITMFETLLGDTYTDVERAKQENELDYIFENGNQTGYTQYGKYTDAMMSAAKNGDQKSFDSALNSLMTDMEFDEKEARSTFRDSIRLSFKSGDIDATTARSYVEDYGGQTADEAYWTVKGWEASNAGDDTYTMYSALHAATISGTGYDSAVKELLNHGITQDQVNTQTRTAIKNAYVSGEADAKTATALLAKYKLSDDSNDTYWALREWDYYKANGTSDGYGKYKDFLGSMKTGTSIKTYADELLNHGVEKSTIARAISVEYKDEYLALKQSSPSAAAAMLEWILDGYEAIGYSRSYETNYIKKNWK